MERWCAFGPAREGERGAGAGAALARAPRDGRARAPRATLWVEELERASLPNVVAIVRDAFALSGTNERALRELLRAETREGGTTRVVAARDAVRGPFAPLVVDVYERRDRDGTFVLTIAGKDLFDWLSERGYETRVVDEHGGDLDFETERASARSMKTDVIRATKCDGVIRSTTYEGRACAKAQSSNACVMVAPSAFASNALAARDNHFMGSMGKMTALDVREKAMEEFKGLYQGLREIGVNVHLFSHDDKHDTPDAVFPNNWHTIRGGVLKLFPMKDENRRKERRDDIIEYLLERDKSLKLDDSLLRHERGDAPKFLEGTGALVIDHVNALAYVALSERAHPDVVKEYCASEGLEPVTFVANDSQGRVIYHTNVVMSVCSTVAIVCLDAIASDADRRKVREKLTASTHARELVEITLDQVNEFCGNVLELRDGAGAPALALSRRACCAFTEPQRDVLKRHFASFVVAEFDVIEKIGGGGVRCAIAETFA